MKVGQSVGQKKKKTTHEGFWVPAKARLLSTKAWLRGPFFRNQNRDYQMSKNSPKMKYRWWFKTIGVNKTRSCACKLKYLLLYKWFWIFFLLFQKNGSVGRWKRKILWGWPKPIQSKPKAISSKQVFLVLFYGSSENRTQSYHTFCECIPKLLYPFHLS